MRFALAPSIVFLFCTTIFAQGNAANPAPPPSAQPRNCRPEIEKFCKDVMFGGGRRLACLAKHKSQLSPVCTKRLAAMQEMFEFGQKQQKKMQEILAKQAKEEAAAAKKQPGPPASKPK